MTDIGDYELLFSAAVKDFWGVRKTQQEAQILKGTPDAGSRGAVTAGKHLDAVQRVILQALQDGGADPDWLVTGRSAAVPGWFRERKAFDVVATDGEHLFVTIELKSQVGSFGNNQNNRIEEAVGQVHDHYVAGSKGLLPGLAPWFGYVLLVEATPESTSARPTTGRTVIPADPTFHGLSYVGRYVVAFDRMVTEKLVDAACVAITNQDDGSVTYPSPAMTFQHFAVALHNRMRAIHAAGYKPQP